MNAAWFAAETAHEILRRFSRWAVVGASSDPYRPSNGVLGRLVSSGYEVIPVNPNEVAVRGLTAYPTYAPVHPTLTIAALALRLGEQLAREAA